MDLEKVQPRLKGRFVKENQKNQYFKRQKMGKDNQNSYYVVPLAKKDVKINYDEVPVEGFRMVDFQHMARNLFCQSCHHPLLIHNIKKEFQEGCGSNFHIKCEKCLEMSSIPSGPKIMNAVSRRRTFAVNTKIVLGALNAGLGPTKVNNMLKVADFPSMTPKTFKNHERMLGPVIEEVARESCSEVTLLESLCTKECVDDLKKCLPPNLQEGFLVCEVEASETDPAKTVVRIFVSYDMGWSQRANGCTYDSYNGYAAIIGLKTGKVLDFCTRNRKCSTCERAAKTGIPVLHDCRLNHQGSAKSMEADAAVQLVVNSKILKEHNVEVGVLIGDEDSTAISNILNVIDHPIVKQSDMNHAKKGVGKLLWEIKSKKNCDPDSELNTDVINYLKDCFGKVVHKNKGDVESIRHGIKNIPFHLFDKHDHCGNWCGVRSNKENYESTKRLKNETLFGTLEKLFNQLSSNAEKFVMAGSSQANESLNNMMCAFCPKNISYSTKESSDYRWACAVCHKNLGNDWIRRVFDKIQIKWSEILMKYIHSTKNVAEKRKEREIRPAIKLVRRENKSKRNQLRHRLEGSEENTYSSNMTLLQSSNSENLEIIEEVANDFEYNRDDVALVFFDLETGGLAMKKDILQIAAKSEGLLLRSFITPLISRSIDKSATAVNRISKDGTQLFVAGNPVNSLSKKKVFQKLLEFFKKLGKKIIMVAHNCGFDSIRIINAMVELQMESEFQEFITGFTDSLKLFREQYHGAVTNCKLTTLAAELLSKSDEGAHDAAVDILLLEELVFKKLDINTIYNSYKSFDQVKDNYYKNERSKQLVKTFAPLKQEISDQMIKRLADNDMSYENLLLKYKEEGAQETINYLKGDINGKSQIIKTQRILNNILQHLEKHCT